MIEAAKRFKEMIREFPEDIQRAIRQSLRNVADDLRDNNSALCKNILLVTQFFQLCRERGTEQALKWADREAPWIREGFEEAMKRREQKHAERDRKAIG